MYICICILSLSCVYFYLLVIINKKKEEEKVSHDIERKPYLIYIYTITIGVYRWLKVN